MQYIHRVIEVEIARGVSEERIWVGGLSQGMGAAMAAVMAGRWKLGGAIGMSGWLPFARAMLKRAEQAAGITGTAGGEGAGNPAAAPVEDDNESPIYHLSLDTRMELLRDLRRNIGLPELNGEGAEDEAIRKVLAIPVWLGHGDMDMTVRYGVGRGVYKALKVLGMSVEWNRYEGLGHWYSCPDEIDDMVSFMVSGGLQLGHDEKVRAVFART